MTVGFVLERARIDGTVRFVERQVRLLRSRGHTVVVACADGPLAGALRRAGAAVHLFRALEGPDPYAAEHRAERAAFARAVAACDAVVCAAGVAFPFAVAAEPRPQLLLDVLANDLFVGAHESTVAVLHAAARDRRLLAHTLEDAASFGAPYGLSAGDFVYAPLPVDRPADAAPIPRTALASPEETLVLTAVRLDDDHVGYVRPLIGAVGRLRGEGRPLRLAIVGGGTHAAALAENAPAHVTFLGFREDLDALYPLADVYVGEGSTRLEAALAGVAVISSCAQTDPTLADRALFLYGMQQGTIASYAPNAVVHPAPFDDALRLVLDDAGLRRRVAARGCARVREVHAPERYATWLEAVIARDAPRSQWPAVTGRLVIDGRDREELGDAALRARADSGLLLQASHAVDWRDYASVDDSAWDALADAARRDRWSQSSSTARPSPERP